MARSASKENLGVGGTRFGAEVGTGVVEAARAEPLRVGSVIDGKYRLERLIGEGGMGTVWSAHHLQLDLQVAIKLLRPGPDNVTLSERLKIEAQSAARLVHPAIVRVFDIDTSEGGEPFIVMELLGGENLADLLDRGRLSGISAVQLLLPIAEALALAHAKGVIHRDLKPQNVFLAQDGERMQPKLLDFGIAKLMSPQVSGSLTDTGVSVGSPDYMSPEQARGSRDVDFRADIWAFSVVLYETVSGSTPFEGDNYNALMRAIVEDEPAPLPIDDNLDQGLAELILWGLAKDRTERPGSMQELGRELARWLIDRGVSEDVCGLPLGPKWITRVAQKSVPVIQLDAPEPARPAPVVRTGTLVSARDSRTVVREPRADSRAAEPASRLPPAWVLAVAVLAIGGGLLWAFGGRGSSEGRGVSAPALDSAAAIVRNVSSAESPSAQPAVPIGIADTPPAPTDAASAKPPTSVIHSAPSLVAQPKAREAKPPAEPANAPSAAKPGRDVHDETRELLQAY
jgi:serine/threonine protein kinase